MTFGVSLVRSNIMLQSNLFWGGFQPALTGRAFNHIIYLMTATATVLYRTPEKIFSAADRGEKVTIRRGKSEYILSKKNKTHALYGCLRGSIKKDSGRPKVRWKAMQ